MHFLNYQNTEDSVSNITSPKYLIWIIDVHLLFYRYCDSRKANSLCFLFLGALCPLSLPVHLFGEQDTLLMHQLHPGSADFVAHLHDMSLRLKQFLLLFFPEESFL